MSAQQKQFDPQVIATTIMGVVQTTLQQMGNLSFSKEPEFVQKNIIEYESRMRADGLEVFNGPCYVSVINFYMDQKALENHDAIGAFILYIDQNHAERLLKTIGYKDFDDEEDEMAFDIVGEFCNVLAGTYKNEISNLGYKDLTMSAPYKYKNSVPEGVEFSYDQYVKHEVSFYLWKQRVIVIDITMAYIPEKGNK